MNKSVKISESLYPFFILPSMDTVRQVCFIQICTSGVEEAVLHWSGTMA